MMALDKCTRKTNRPCYSKPSAHIVASRALHFFSCLIYRSLLHHMVVHSPVCRRPDALSPLGRYNQSRSVEIQVVP